MLDDDEYETKKKKKKGREQGLGILRGSEILHKKFREGFINKVNSE